MHSFKSVLVIGVLGITAHSRGAAAAPRWCETQAIKSVTLDSGDLDEIRHKDPRRALPVVVAATCNPDDEAKSLAKEIEAARVAWSKQMDLTDADWTDIGAWSALSQGERNGLRLKAIDKKALSALEPLDQYAALIYTKYSSGDAHYMIDALEPRLAQAGRLAYVELCLGSRKPVEWAMCQADISALDPKQLSGEIRAAATRPPHERAMVRVTLELLRPKLAEHSAAIKELQAKEPGYETLFKLATDARNAYAVKSELRDLLLAMDDARTLNSTTAYAGCEEKTWPALASTIGAIPAEKFGGLKDEPGTTYLDNIPSVLINNPDAYVASAAHVICLSDRADALVQALAAAMLRWPGFRGPRNAALTAMVTANVKLDDRAARIDWPNVMRFGGVRAANVNWTGGRGPVSAVKKQGSEITVEFVKKLRKESVCTDWKDTNKIVMISSSGQVIYDYICLKRGTITINEGSRPNTVDARYAQGLKPGVSVSISSGIVAGVWTKPGTPPIAVLGVAVK